MTQLIFTTAGFKGQSFQIPEGKTTIGRATPNTLIILDDSLSAQHCEILCYGREVIVRDLASTNGTWLDDCRVKGQTALRHGQRLRLGVVEARLELPPPSTENQHTEFTAIHSLAHFSNQEVPKSLSPVIIKPSP